MLAVVLSTNRLGPAEAIATMVRSPQKDLFDDDVQPELFQPDAAPPVYRPDPDEVRLRLHRILAEARAAEKLPWDDDKLLVYRAIFPQMAGWLPEEEGAQLQFEFDTEMARLKAA
jgi:hypothetical protein